MNPKASWLTGQGARTDRERAEGEERIFAIWNRRELVAVLTMQEQSDILSALRDTRSDYVVKVINRSSSPVPSPGIRADFDTMGMSPGAQYECIIHASKRDYDATRNVAGLLGDIC